MKFYEITLNLACTYTIPVQDVKGDKNLAIDRAIEWFQECAPNIEVEIKEEREDN